MWNVLSRGASVVLMVAGLLGTATTTVNAADSRNQLKEALAESQRLYANQLLAIGLKAVKAKQLGIAGEALHLLEGLKHYQDAGKLAARLRKSFPVDPVVGVWKAAGIVKAIRLHIGGKVTVVNNGAYWGAWKAGKEPGTYVLSMREKNFEKKTWFVRMKGRNMLVGHRILLDLKTRKTRKEPYTFVRQ